MFRKKKKKRPEISAPKNFEHRVHTSFDAKRGCFVGLPTQWQSLIENLRRPKPMVDPSRITEVELRPKKVCYLALYWFSVLTLRWLLMNGTRRWFPLSCNELHSQRNMCWSVQKYLWVLSQKMPQSSDNNVESSLPSPSFCFLIYHVAELMTLLCTLTVQCWILIGATRFITPRRQLITVHGAFPEMSSRRDKKCRYSKGNASEW